MMLNWMKLYMLMIDDNILYFLITRLILGHLIISQLHHICIDTEQIIDEADYQIKRWDISNTGSTH